MPETEVWFFRIAFGLIWVLAGWELYRGLTVGKLFSGGFSQWFPPWGAFWLGERHPFMFWMSFTATLLVFLLLSLLGGALIWRQALS